MEQPQVDLWLRTQGAAERSFQNALLKYLQGQAGRVAEALADFDQITPSIVPLIFRADDEAELLRPIVHSNLLGMMAIGARDEFDTARPGKSAGLEQVPSSEAVARIGQALEELEAQPYWRAIQAETETRLTEVIRLGLENQSGNYRIGMDIREHLGGFPANKRAQKIARTEVTGALNAGHEASRQVLYNEGLLLGKRWLTVGDRDVRTSHDALNQATAGPAEDFDVGGYSAPYPGWWGLPAQQRIHCRCTTISVLGDA
jgi:hypothetical protein